jgi:predicted dehydrogenase
MSMLTAGVVGLGLGRTHVEGYAKDPRVGRIVICDTSEERIEAVRRDYSGVGAAYTNLEEMLSSERLDVVSVVTPDGLHVPHASLCLDAGCHTLITKPLATTIEDGRRILDAARNAQRSNGTKAMVAHERRFRAFTREIKTAIGSGALGAVIHLRIDQIQDKRSFIAARPWLFAGEGSRTALTGSGIHEVDRVRHLVGDELVEVFAYGNRMGGIDIPANTTMSVLMQFASGAIGQVTITYDAHWPASGDIDDGFRLVAQKGLVVGRRLVHDGLSGWHELPVDHHSGAVREGSLGCLRSFLDSVVDDRPVEVPVEEGFASLAACIAAEESAGTGQPCRPKSP